MNAPFVLPRDTCRLADLAQPDEVQRIEAFVAGHPEGTPFHRPLWLKAVARATGNRALGLVLEKHGVLVGWLPLSEVHSPLFGRLLASSGFGVGGGLLLADGAGGAPIFAALEELAQRRACPAIELRGGEVPDLREGWTIRTDSHCGFVAPLAGSDEGQLLAIPRKQRAEVRKGLGNDFSVTAGRSEADRTAHYAAYAESVRNLGTPVFPRSLFDAVLDGLGEDADILTVRHDGAPVASVLSLYHRGRTVMPYWGGGTLAARHLRANEVMYFELMLHARRRGCARFDFGRSKTGSGAYLFKRNWGFEPAPLRYAQWTAPGIPQRDADPTSAAHSAKIALWRHLPLPIANRIGPWIARGLG